MFPKRTRVELDRRKLQSLRLRETNEGNRLTVDADALRLDIAPSASEIEREWLYAREEGDTRPTATPAINPDLALPRETAVDRGVPHAPHEQRTGARVTASGKPERWRNAWQWGGPNRHRKAPAPLHSRPN
jgi:hypothetical protein